MIKSSSEEVCLTSFLNKRKPYNENRLSAKGKSTCPTPKSLREFVASRSSDEMVRKYENFKSKDKSQVVPKRQKALEESNGCMGRSHLLLSEELIRRIDQQRQKFKKREELAKLQPDKRKTHTPQLKEISNKPGGSRKVRLNAQYPHKSQIVLTDNSPPHATPTFTPVSDCKTRPSLLKIQPQLSQSNTSRSMTPRKQVIISNLEIIHEEKSEMERMKSQSIVKTSKEPIPEIVYSYRHVTEDSQQNPGSTGTDQSQRQDVRSPIRNYQKSVSVAIQESISDLSDPHMRKLFMSGLMELYLQQYEKQGSINLASLEEREYKSVSFVRPSDKTMSLDRLSPIPLEDSLKSHQIQSIHLYNSVSRDETYRNESSIRPNNHIRSVESYQHNPQLPMAQSTGVNKPCLKITRKPNQSPVAFEPYLNNFQLTLPRIFYNKPYCNPELPNRHQVSTRNYQTESIPTERVPTICFHKSIAIDWSAGKLTERSEKRGISLSRRSEQKLKLKSQQRPVSSFLKIKKVQRAAQQNPKQIVRLGTKIILTLADDKKPGLRLVSQEPRSRSWKVDKNQLSQVRGTRNNIAPIRT